MFYEDTNAPPPPCTLSYRFEQKKMWEGEEYYTDRSYTLTDIPSKYTGMDMISTPNDERNRTEHNGYMRFKMTSAGYVYVAFDRRAATLPDWMSGFEDTRDKISTSLSSQGYLNVYRKRFSSGICVDFGANKGPGSSGGTRSNYIVFHGDAASQPSCVLAGKFETENLSQGMEYYTDRNYTLTAVPQQYLNMAVIKTPNDERGLTDPSDYLTFEMSSSGYVYVAFDRRATSLPNWMTGFIDTERIINTSLTTQSYLKIYRKYFSSGSCVNLGANRGSGSSGRVLSNFIVFY